MADRTSSVSHRAGRRVHYIPPVEGRAAPWPTVYRVLDHASFRAATAAAASATIRRWHSTDDRIRLEHADAKTLRHLSPDELIEVRRPSSHQGMRNYVGQMRVPTDIHGLRVAWFESFNEQAHLRDLLLASAVTQLATQALRFEWAFDDGIRSHIPDALCRLTDGTTVLLDVTRLSVLNDPKRKAIFQLTASSAGAMGWRYEVRTELPDQRARNVSFLWVCRGLEAGVAEESMRSLRGLGWPSDVHAVATRLGGTQHALGRAWQLLAARHLFLNMDLPIAPDTAVTARQRRMPRPPWVHEL